jgi:dTDP-4-amino-4,6-dideoxygalactose transaminase
VIPLVDLNAQYRSIKNEVHSAIERVLEGGQFILGPEVTAFEEEFATHCQSQHAIAVNTGTSALHLALLAAGVGPGDEVVTVPFTFVATAAAIEYTGAKPVFVDIDPVSYNMDPAKIEGALTDRTKAIVPVHLYGQSADMKPIMEIARNRGLVVIEDACQAHGAEYDGRRVGGVGDLGCFSFYPGKNLGAYGEGGMVVSNNPSYADAVRTLRDWGQQSKYHHVVKGYNYRLDGIQGAILRIKLRHLDNWTDARRQHARTYDELLRDLNVNSLSTPVELDNRKHVYHVYAIRLRERNAVHRTLNDSGIQAGIHYPVPVHLQPAYTDLGYHRGDFPHSERAAAEVLSLPMYPELTTQQLNKVCSALVDAVEQHDVPQTHGEIDDVVGLTSERVPS